MIVAERITVGYVKGYSVLRDISLNVKPGQILAVTGSSGAGKTTLLWTLAGLLAPAFGQIKTDGSPRTVLIQQNNALASVLTAAENIEVALLANGAPKAQVRQLAAEALERLGLEGQADQLVEELSGGQQQRTAVARGLALRPELLLADEVTSELDAANRQRVLRLLRAEADKGAAVIFATHDPQAAAFCDDELHLVDGYAPVTGLLPQTA